MEMMSYISVMDISTQFKFSLDIEKDYFKKIFKKNLPVTLPCLITVKAIFFLIVTIFTPKKAFQTCRFSQVR